MTPENDIVFDNAELREDSIRFLGEHTVAVIHELRSPLAGLRAQLQLMSLRLGRQGENISACAGMMKQIDDMSRICDQIMNFSRGCVEQEMSTVDMAEVCMDAAALLHALAIAKGIRLELALAEDVPKVFGDENMLRRLLINLVSNAVQALEGYRTDGVVRIELGRDGDDLRLMVEDNGPGMDAATMGRIFDAGFSTKANGGGLGLSICARIVRRHCGQLTVFSRKAAGAKFILTLPAEE